MIQLAALFQVPFQQTQVGPLIEQLRAIQSGATIRTQGIVVQAAQGTGITCNSCFDSELVLNPSPTTLVGVVVPEMPDQPIVALDSSHILATAYVSAVSAVIPALDGNTEGAVFYAQSSELAAYLCQGYYYLCLCVTLPNGSVPNPAVLIMQANAIFNLCLTGH